MMSNFISRDAVIEALQKEREYLLADERFGAEHILVHHALNIIDELPCIMAIPVEWLEGQVNDTTRAPLYRQYAQMLYDEWRKEQEVR